MKTFYKIFLILFIVCIAISFYAIDWSLGFWNDENTKFVFPIASAILGIIVILVLNTWSKLADKK